jgi:hypothetical protein
MSPTEVWLSKGALRSMSGQCGRFHGKYEARVQFKDAGRVVASGRGATLEEACANACNALMNALCEKEGE